MDELYNETRKWFLSFLARTSQKRETVDHILRFLPKYSPQFIKARDMGLDTNILVVGPGIGKVTIPLMEHFGQVNLSSREPNIGMGVNFVLNYLSYDLPFGRLHLDAKTSVDYGTEKYDFILASHVFYYLPDWEEALQSIYDALIPGGAACVILGSERSGLYQFRNEFFPDIHGVTPHSGEKLIDIVEKMGFVTNVQDINSWIDLSAKERSLSTSLLEADTWDPSLDALLSFMLRYDFSKLDLQIQRRVQEYTHRHVDANQHLPMVDKAVWLVKPGSYLNREKVIQTDEEDVTLSDFMEIFRPQLEANFGADVDFLTPSLREVYFDVIALDCLLTHPLSRRAMIARCNHTLVECDEYLPIPIPGRRITDFTLWSLDGEFAPGEVLSIKDLIFRDKEYYFLFFIHGSNSDYYLTEHIRQEFSFLPESDRQLLGSEYEFLRLVLNLADNFNHKQIFSNRFDGSTVLGMFLRSLFINQKKLRTMDGLSQDLANIYKQMYSKPSVLHSIEV